MLWALALLMGCEPRTIDDEALLTLRPATPAPYRQDLDVLPCGTPASDWGVCIEADVRLTSARDGTVAPLDPLPYDATNVSGLWVGAAIHEPWTVEAGETIRAPYMLCLSCWDGDPAPPVGEYVTDVAWALYDGDDVLATASAEIVVVLWD